jgi:hypothetical protein
MRTAQRSIQRQQGSVYILALLVLLILTIVGLSLSLVTQSEMQIGVNERLSHQAFHSATAGIGIGTAKALVMPDLRSFEIDLVEPNDEVANLNIRHRLEVSPFLPILSAPCNLCQINEGAEFMKINHAVSSTATRIAWMGAPGNPPGVPSPLAQERVSLLVSFQPWRMDITTGVDAATDPNRGGLKNAF